MYGNRIDPTGTSLIRASLDRELTKRFSSLHKLLTELLVTEDALGLVINGFCSTEKGSGASLLSNEIETAFPSSVKHVKMLLGDISSLTTNENWKLDTTPNKLANFQQWLDSNINAKVLTKVHNGFWTDPYVKQAYDKAVDKAFKAVRKSKGGKDAAKEFKTQFSKIGVEKLKLLQAQTFNHLKGITSAMSSKISNALIEGISKGLSPDALAEVINDRVSKIGITRAKTLARTEIVRAHSDATLDALEQLGVKSVGINIEWRTGLNPCPVCASLSNTIMTIEQARGLFPRHPNCFCSPVPSENKTNTNLLKSRIKSSLSKSKGSNWSGSQLLKGK